MKFKLKQPDTHGALSISSGAWVFEPLEPRLLLSADPLGAAPDVGVPFALDDRQLDSSLDYFTSLPIVEVSSHGALPLLSSPIDVESLCSAEGEAEPLSIVDCSQWLTSTAVEGSQVNRTEVIFVDTSVENHQAFLESVHGNSSTEYLVFTLSENEDGVVQMSNVLAQLNDVSAIHILGHGTNGELQLGNAHLSTETLSSYEDKLSGWANSTQDGADVLLYGCSLAENDAGKAFLAKLQNVFQLDVAASDDLTGSQFLGGDWDLEYAMGDITAVVPFSQTFQQSWNGVLVTITVTTNSDFVDGDVSSLSSLLSDPGGDGEISFREAINVANNSPNTGSPDEIHFSLTGSNTIVLNSSLPGIDEAVIIDGTTDNDYTDKPVVELDGSNLSALFSGLSLSSNGSTVDSLIIKNFPFSGIVITGNGNTVIGSYIGTSSDGLNEEGNGFNGISIFSASSNIIGGFSATERNVISGNDGRGIYISGNGADDNTVVGNYIGTDLTGSYGIKNGGDGVWIGNGASSNIIGGTVGNVISGNEDEGIEIADSNSRDNLIIGNFIGTNAAGTGAVANEGMGVLIEGAKNNTIGGSSPSDRNVISGNGEDGVVISGSSAQNNIIKGNYIGTNADGSGALGNQGSGILITTDIEDSSGAAKSVTIGGASSGEGNLISGNAGHGVLVDGGTNVEIIGNLIGTSADGIGAIANGESGVVFTNGASGNVVGGEANGEGNTIAFNSKVGVLVEDSASTSNLIIGNKIFTNDEMGIDLNDDGVTANDALDADGGANDSQNYPTLTLAESGVSNIRITGSLESLVSTTFDIHFYSSSSVDDSGNGEGETYLGSAQVTTDSSGNASFDVTLVSASVAVGHFVSATASNSGSTSEFSTSLLVTGSGNNEATGTVSITGSATEDATLTANHSGISDVDGISGSFSYQWVRDGVKISGATASTYVLTDDDVGGMITVIVGFTDDLGNEEGIESSAVGPVTNVNDGPTGSVGISGTAIEDQVLTASNTLADDDGLGSISYQWQRDGVAISGATASTYTLTDNDVGTQITVVASYTDDQGQLESVSSDPTAVVSNINDEPTGNVSINGSAIEDQVLTASNTLADDDGLGSISYQWQRDGVAISGATASTYTLTDNDVGTQITVVASYTDDQGQLESVSSDPTAVVSNINDEPTGNVSINGSAIEDQVLTASNTLADNDGLGSVSYQWQRDGVAISGATASSYTLTDADVGTEITVVASYTDDQGQLESVSSNPTAVVSNINDEPTGSVSISGTAIEDQVLTASNTLADDDGLGSISYQWQRDGVDISGATASSYTLTDADVGTEITVVASYTDDRGQLESVSSEPVNVVRLIEDVTESEEPPTEDTISQEPSVILEDIDEVSETTNEAEEPVVAESSQTDEAEDQADNEDESQNENQQQTESDSPLVLLGDLSAPSVYYENTDTLLNGVSFDSMEQKDYQVSTVATVFGLENSISVLNSEFLKTALLDSSIPSLNETLGLITTTDYVNALEGVQQVIEGNTVFSTAVLGGSTALTTGLSVGYAIWLVRSGVIVSGVLSSLPAWRFVDPLPILQGLTPDSDDEESLQTMVSAGDAEEEKE